MHQNQEPQPNTQPATMEGAARVMSLQAEAAASLAVFHEGAAFMTGENTRKLQAAVETMGGQLQKQASIHSNAKLVCKSVETLLSLWVLHEEDSDVMVNAIDHMRVMYENYTLSADGPKGG